MENNNSNNLKKKGILLAISILLLIAAGIYFTLAWYTKMTSVGGLEFDVARWDFSANYSIDAYTINVYTYSNVHDQKAAPGTAGVIPIMLNAEESEADINYKLMIDRTTMSEEFQERIFFYVDEEMTEMITDENPITGIAKMGVVTEVPIYWKWIYEQKDIPDGYYKIIEDADKFDVFDTEVGKRPDLYEPLMNATILITGLQDEPVLSSTSSEEEKKDKESESEKLASGTSNSSETPTPEPEPEGTTTD